MASTEAASPPTRTPIFGGCWSCRILSGSGLLAASGYVYNVARNTMKKGAPVGMGTVTQMVFAVSLACWGAVILVDPVGKAKPKDA